MNRKRPSHRGKNGLNLKVAPAYNLAFVRRLTSATIVPPGLKQMQTMFGGSQVNIWWIEGWEDFFVVGPAKLQLLRFVKVWQLDGVVTDSSAKLALLTSFPGDHA